MRQDTVYSFYLYHWYIINDDIYAAERETLSSKSSLQLERR